MQVLQGGYVHGVSGHGTNAAGRRAGGGKRGDAWDVVTDRGATDGFLVVEGLAAERSVDDEVDFAGFDQVDDIRTAFVDLVDGFDFDTRAGESGRGAARGDDLIPAARRSCTTNATWRLS